MKNIYLIVLKTIFLFTSLSTFAQLTFPFPQMIPDEFMVPDFHQNVDRDLFPAEMTSARTTYSNMLDNAPADSLFEEKIFVSEHTYDGENTLTYQIMLPDPSAEMPPGGYPLVYTTYGRETLAEAMAMDAYRQNYPCYVVSFMNTARPGPLHPPPAVSDYAYLFLEIFDSLFVQYPDLDTNRIYASGWSRGGSACSILSYARPGLLAAMVPSAGGFQNLTGDPNSLLDVKILSLQGQNDGNSNPNGSLHAYDSLAKLGALDNIFWWVVDAGHSPHDLGWYVADVVHWMFDQTREDLPLRPNAAFTTDITDEDVPFTINYDASGSTPNNGGSIVSYEWEIFKSVASIADYSERYLHGYTLDTGFHNATLISTDATMQYTLEEPGIYWVRVIVTDNDGNRRAKTQQIFARSIKPEASFLFNKNHERAQQAITFDASETKADYQETITSYDWNFGDGNNASGVRVSHAYASPGVYTAELIVTSSSGAKDTTTHNVTVTDVFPGYRYFRFVGLTCHYTYRGPRIHHFAFLNGADEFPEQAMISNNSQGITLEASWGTEAYKAFDKDLSTSWLSHNYHTPVTLDIDVSEEQRFVPTGLSMSMESSTNRFTDFYIEASVDQYMWDTLYINPSGNEDLANVQFENVPYVTIETPQDAASFNEGDDISLSVSTSNFPSPVEKVKYFANGSYIGESTSSPSFTYSWTNVAADLFELTSRAYYNTLADSVFSNTVNITVLGPPVFSGINVSPSDIIIDSAGTQTYVAEAIDQYSNVLASQPSFTWESTGGSIDASGLFTANDNPDTYYVKATATVDGTTITDSTSVTINLPGSGCVEDFNDNALSDMWTTIIQCEDNQGSVAETGGQLVIDAATSACNNFYSSPRKFFNGIFSAPVAGDFEVSVKVVSGSSADNGSRAGILISRDISAYGTADAAGLAAVLARPGGNDYRLYSDPDQDGWLSTLDNPGVSLSYPTWLKIERIGDNVTGYISSNGTDWTTIATRNIGYGTESMEIALVSAQAAVVFDDLVMSSCPSVPLMPARAVIIADALSVETETEINFDASASLPAEGANSIENYEWDFRDGNTAFGVNTSHAYSSTGTYSVLLTITDDMGNTDTDSLEITVNVRTSTTVNKNDEISIYPNPTSDYLLVEGVEAELSYRIFSLVGEEVATGICKGKIDVGVLSPGFYLLQIRGEYLKFLKE